MKPIVSALILTTIASFWLPAISSDTGKPRTPKKGALDNPYEDGMDKAAANIVNSSLGSVGKRVVITMRKRAEVLCKNPWRKYSLAGDDTAKAVLATTSRLTSAIDKAKSKSVLSSVVIEVECK